MFAPLLQAQSDRQISLEFDSNSYSEASSLYSIAGHWNDKVKDGNEAWSLLRLTLGVKQGGYSIQTIMRDDSFFRFANETARFIYQTNNHLPLNAGREYRLYILADKASSRGLRFGLQQPINDRFSIKGYVSLLQPTRLIQGHIDGRATIVGSTDYDFSFDSDLVYGKDPLFERSTGRLSGQGYSIDLSGRFQPADNWQIDLQLLDIAGQINFSNAPATLATASSDVKHYDDNGYVTYDPAISGRDFYRDYRYHFEEQIRLGVTWQWSQKLRLAVEHRRVYGFDYQKLTAEQNTAQGILRWSYVPRMNAFGLALLSKHFSFGLESDRLSVKQMKYLSLSSSFYWSF